MNIIIVGGGKSGAFLAERLGAKHDVTLVESRHERVAELVHALDNVKVIRGDGCEPVVLERAGVAHTDLVAALTGDDEDNLVVSLLAKRMYRTPIVMARVNHPKNEWLFTKQWGVDAGVSTASVIYNMVEKEVTLGDIVTLLRLKADNVAIEEVKLPTGAGCVGRKLADVHMPESTQVMAIISNGEITAAKGDTLLCEGDELLLLTDTKHRDETMRALGLDPKA